MNDKPQSGQALPITPQQLVMLRNLDMLINKDALTAAVTARCPSGLEPDEVETELLLAHAWWLRERKKACAAIVDDSQLMEMAQLTVTDKLYAFALDECRSILI